MENIRKDVEEGIVYLRTHAHLLQPTESMPSEKLQPLKLPPMPVPLTTMPPSQDDAKEKLTIEPIINKARSHSTPPPFARPTGMHANRNMRKRFPNHFKQVKDTAIDHIIQNQHTFTAHNADSSADENSHASSHPIPGTDAMAEPPTASPPNEAPLKMGKTSFDHVNDEKHNLNGNLVVQSVAEENATGDKFNINLNNKFEYNLEKHQPEALKGSFTPSTLPTASAASTHPPTTRIDSEKMRSDKIEGKPAMAKPPSRQVNPAPSKFQSDTNDATLNVGETIADVAIEDNNRISNNLRSNSDGDGSSVENKVQLPIHPSFNLYSSDEGDAVVVAIAANASEQTENEIIFPSNNDDVDDNDNDTDSGDDVNDNDFERNINFDLTNDNLNDITPAIYRMDAIELAQMNEMDETSRKNRLKMMKGKDVVTEFLQIVERSMDNNCSAGTAVNLGEGVVDQYAQERFRVKADVAVNRANMLTRYVSTAHT